MAAQHGGKRNGAGRPSGATNRATTAQRATLSELARAHTDLALGVLVQVAKNGESESARVSAACALLDRAYGKPSQINELSVQPEDRLNAVIREINQRGSTAPMSRQ